MGVPGKVGQNGSGPAERGFGVDHPVNLAQRRQPFGEVAEEPQLPGTVQVHQPFKKEAAEQPRQHAHMQKEPRPTGDPPGAIRREASAWDDHVDMRMVRHCRTPSMEHAGHANAGTKALGIGGDGHYRFCRRSRVC